MRVDRDELAIGRDRAGRHVVIVSSQGAHVLSPRAALAYAADMGRDRRFRHVADLVRRVVLELEHGGGVT